MDPVRKIEEDQAIFAVIDIQEGLVKAMDETVGRNVIRNVQTLLSVAKEMEIPVVPTEQYPRGLGTTVAGIKEDLTGDPIEKVSFSCCRVEAFNERLSRLGRKQIILSGMETHICVLQTCADLIERGYEVHVLADAVCSRRKLDWEIGLSWMEKKGAIISTTEMIAFQLLKEAGTERFKRVSKRFK
jgi:nicotinamidase-related amidase